jgi:hypothetical protein
VSAHDTADDGLPARSVFHHITMPPRRRRTTFERVSTLMRRHVGMGVCMAMLIASAALVVLSR